MMSLLVDFVGMFCVGLFGLMIWYLVLGSGSFMVLGIWLLVIGLVMSIGEYLFNL